MLQTRLPPTLPSDQRASGAPSRPWPADAGLPWEGRVRPEIAVVIVARDRPEALRRCLRALLRQSVPPDSFEVVVVDDGSQGKTREVVAEAAALSGGMPAVRYLRNLSGPGAAAARNCGWQASAAPLIAFTEEAGVPDHHWLREGRRAMGGWLIAASGRLSVPLQGRPTDHARATQRLEQAEFATANAFVRRDALVTVGGFDARFTRAGGDDADLYFSLLATGGRIGHAPDALVLHPVPPARWGSALVQQADLRFDALLRRKHPRLFRSKLLRPPPWRDLAIVALTLAAIAASLLQHPGWAVACGAGAAAGIAGSALQRLRGTSHAPSHVAEVVATSLAMPYMALLWRLVGWWRFRVAWG